MNLSKIELGIVAGGLACLLEDAILSGEDVNSEDCAKADACLGKLEDLYDSEGMTTKAVVKLFSKIADEFLKEE